MSFDADLFLSTQIDQPLETRRRPVPPGEYTARIVDVKAKAFDSKKNPGEQVTVMSVGWEIDDPSGQVEQATGLASPRVSQDIFLDVTAQGALATGPNKNIGLGKLREAVNQNVAGQPWGPTMLGGAVARIRVENEPDSNDASILYDRVKGVAKL